MNAQIVDQEKQTLTNILESLDLDSSEVLLPIIMLE